MKKLTLLDIQNRLQNIHGDMVTLDVNTYKDITTKACFIDKEFGDWWVLPTSVLRGTRHPKHGFWAHKKQFCSKGHDTFITGRYQANGGCRECSKNKTGLFYKLSHNLRSRLNIAIKQKHLSKKSKLSQYLGCTLEGLKIHLEKQWTIGMSWDNYGFGKDKWNVDHILPLATAKTEEELYKLCHYTNLQPLWQVDNFKKHDKILLIGDKDIC